MEPYLEISALRNKCLRARSVVSNSCNRMDYSPPGSYVHEISQPRILEWVAISFFRGSFQPLGSNPCLPHWQVDSLPLSHQGSQESENQTLGFITAEVALEKVDLECDYRGAFCIPPSPVLNPQVDTTESAE